MAGLISRGSDSAYGGSKGALERLNDAMRRLFLSRRIIVSLLEPGFVASGM